MYDYFTKVAILLSQTANVLLFNGNPDVTVSARAFANREKRFWGILYRAINLIFFFQNNHCMLSFLTDLQNSEAVIKIAKKEDLYQ